MSLTLWPWRTTVTLCSWRCSWKHQSLSTSWEFYKLPSPVHCQHCSYWGIARSFYSSVTSLENANLSAVRWKVEMWATLQQLQSLTGGAAGNLLPSPYCLIHFQTCGPEFVHLSYQEIVWSPLSLPPRQPSPGAHHCLLCREALVLKPSSANFTAFPPALTCWVLAKSSSAFSLSTDFLIM